MTKSTGNHLEDISPAHVVSLVYKLITSAKDSDDLSIGFDRDRGKRRDELAHNKLIKGKYKVRIMRKDTFGLAERQEKTTYGFGYKSTLTRKKGDAVLDKAAGIADARIKIDHIHWFTPHYALSIQQQGFLLKQISAKTSTELR